MKFRLVPFEKGEIKLKRFIEMLQFLDTKIGNVEVKKSDESNRWIIEIFVETPKK